jgi:protein-S-isoprenylcysteine O-methyltransferase Ste14
MFKDFQDLWLKLYYPIFNIVFSALLAIPYAIYSLIRWLITGQSAMPALMNLVTNQAIFGVLVALVLTVIVAMLSRTPFLIIVILPLVLLLAAQLALRTWIRRHVRQDHATSSEIPKDKSQPKI